MFWVILAVIGLVVSTCSASAQSSGDSSETWSKPAYGGTVAPPDDDPSQNPFNASGSDEILRHRDFAGKPCLVLQGYARAHTIDPNLYDDVVSISNSCPRQISVRVCYYGTEDCISVDVPGTESKEIVLGMLPSMKDFRFEFREKFDE